MVRELAATLLLTEFNHKKSLSRVLRHLVRRETTEMADVQTEKVIQVIAPNDVQFTLNTREEKGEEEPEREVTVVR